MRKISTESKDFSNLANRASDGNVDETAILSEAQSSDQLPRPVKKRRTTQFASHVPRICQLWTSLSPQEKLKWEQMERTTNASPQSLKLDNVDASIGPDLAEL